MVAGRANENRKGTKNMTQDAWSGVKSIERLWYREVARLLGHSREIVEKVMAGQGDKVDPELVSLQHELCETEKKFSEMGGGK
jgi:hypothetical protein